MRRIELLSPAKTAEHGIEAISHGADAVYIGAPKFSARANAPNGIGDIESLINFAHRYYAKVYVALNTILTMPELEEAEKIIHQLYNIGTDALIIQDFGITQLNLPPIPLHASTQMDNRNVEKVSFLEKAGFEQVVLARELSIEQIRDISRNTKVKLEFFVHGALCVSYSGQCYLSQSLCGRSANRGVCAQPCRLPYTLKDAQGKILEKDRYLLSLKDMNLSNSLEELIDAGVSSLKIEGRLKDVDYVKNVTAYYRQRLDAILEGSNEYQKASSGHCQYTFIPNVEKSFHRGSTDYFLHKRTPNITSFDTPKSLGEIVGSVKSSNGKSIVIDTEKSLHNGDGFCYITENRQFSGFKANTVDGNEIFPSEKIFIRPGTIVYRNFDQTFERELKKKSADRRIAIQIEVQESVNGFLFKVKDEDGNVATHKLETEKQLAQDITRQIENTTRILSKCGDTIFNVSSVSFATENTYFFPSAQLAEVRRTLIQKLEEERSQNRVKSSLAFPKTSHPYPLRVLSYKGNVHNPLAEKFFKEHQVTEIQKSFESQRDDNAELMRCKHCIAYSLGYCTKQQGGKERHQPFILTTNMGKELLLSFDCANCEMVVKKK